MKKTMRDFTIQLAGRVVAVSAIEETVWRFFQEYMCEEKPDFTVAITAEDIEFEREKSIREDALEGHAPRVYSNAYLETIAIQRKVAEKLFDYDTLLFHGSVVSVDGEAYLFTAKSGTGKSTHTRLWRELLGDRAVMVNDDKPFLQITENGIIAYGSPWNGKHKLGANISVPLKAICLLEQGKENCIEKISPKDTLFMLIQQSNRPQSSRKMPQYLALLDALSQRANFYRLKCNMDPQAAIMAYEAMSEN